jgi:hypothetical protein
LQELVCLDQLVYDPFLSLMTDINPDEDTPSLAPVGGDSEVDSAASSQEDSSSEQPVDINGTAADSTTAAESSGSAPNNTSGNDDLKAAASTDSCSSIPHNTSGNGSVSTSSKPKPSVIKSRTSFTADSPYFTSFCDGEIKSLNILTESLGDISARTKTFCRTQALMSEAMQRLANSCKLRPERNLSQDDSDEESHEREDVVQQRRQAVGEEMATLLQLLGEVSHSVCLFVR